MASFFCPNQDCQASAKSNTPIQAPLVELPVDPNHVFLECPFCRQRITQCDGCSALIADFDDQDRGEIFCFCRKCGFPNLLDAEARIEFSLPRNHPLPFSTARAIQRAVGRNSYKNYKSQEISNLEKALKNGIEASSDQVIVIVGKSSPTSTHSANLMISPSVTTNYKKRVRSNGQGDGIHGQEIEEAAKGQKRLMRAPVTANGEDHRVRMADTAGLVPETKEGDRVLLLESWKSHLKVPVEPMLPVLRSQLQSWDAKRCIEYDDRLLQSLDFRERALSFKLVHTTLLKSLLDFSNPSNRIGTIGDLLLSPAESTSKDLCGRLDLFLAEQDSILELKANLYAAEMESAFSSSKTGALSISNLSALISKAGITESIAKVIIGLLTAKKKQLSILTRSKTSPHLPLLQLISGELQRAYKGTKLLMAVDPASLTHTTAEGAPTASDAIQADLPSTWSSKTRNNTIEHTKLYALLLGNLYKTVAAVVL